MGKRPDGITLLAILEAINGVYTLLGGLVTILLLEISGLLDSGARGMAGAIGVSRETLPGFIVPLIMGVAVILAIYHFTIVYTFWTGKKWGWTLGMILPLIPIIGGVVIYSFSNKIEHIFEVVPSIILGIIIVVYLTRPHVKAYFGKS